MLKAIIFDFDGVISESVGVKADGFAAIYEPFGKEVIRKVLDHHYLNGGISRFDKLRFYHKNFLGIELNGLELEKLAEKFSNFVVKKIINAQYVNGAIDFFENNYKKYKLFISTGTPQDEIEIIIKEKEIDHYFIEVHGSPRSKIDHINSILINNDLSKHQTIFVGDAKQDCKAAKTAGLKFIARIHEKNLFLEEEPYLVKDLSELEKLILNDELQY